MAPPLADELDYSTATFLENDFAVLGSYGGEIHNTSDSVVVVWDIASNEMVRKTQVDGEIGNFVGTIGNQVIDVYKYLKLVDLDRGTVSVLDDETRLSSQRSPIVHRQDLVPFVTYSKEVHAIAARYADRVEIL